MPDAGKPFIGRQAELDVLRGALERAVGAEPRMVLLAGEPGIGKTRTAQETAEHASRRGMLAIWGRCPEEPGAPPYWPWLQVIRRYIALHDDEALRTTIGAAAAPLAAIDPELAHRFGGAATAAEAPAKPDAAQARFRLFDAMAGFWRRAAARQPLLLVLDDLHRADVSSLRLLEFVMAEAGDSRLMVLGTCRVAELTRSHPLSDTLAQLARHTPLARIAMKGFSVLETAQYLCAATGVASSELAAQLHRQTEGHPLFLSELIRDTEQLQAWMGSHAAGAPGAALRVSGGVTDAIGARLNRLRPLTVAVLQNAAVIGRQFSFDLLCRLVGDASPDPLLDALQEARTAGLVDATADAGRYAFTHALIRETLYDEIPGPRRAPLHERIAAVLEAQHRDDLAPCLSELAHHYIAAGQASSRAKAIEYATRAAQHASAMLAHEEAARHYELALSALARVPSADAQRSTMQLALGDAQDSSGDSALALATFKDAAASARRLGDASLLARAAIGFGNSLWRLGGEGSKAVELIREALALLEPSLSRLRVALLSSLCRALIFSNRSAEAEAAYREAVALARQDDDPQALVNALSAIVPGRWFPEGLSLRLGAAREAIAISLATGHPEWAFGFISGWHIGDLMEIGDTAGASEMARLLLSHHDALQQPFGIAVGYAALAMIAAHEGRFDEAEQLASRARAQGARFDANHASGTFSVQMFTLRRQQGRLAEVAPVLRQFLLHQPQASTWRPGLVVLHCELGDREAARAEFERLAASDFGGIQRDAIWVASIAYVAEVCAWLDDAPRAAVLYELLLPYAERNIVFGAHSASFGAGARFLGQLAATLQRFDAAVGHFERALALDASSGGAPWLARSRCEFAAMLIRRARPEDGERAASLLQAALADARRLGMHGLEQRAIELQRQVSGRSQRAARPAGLTDREVQVLQLVAAGSTNQQIADALCRSPSTVAIHVRNILEKTHASNRAEAAAFAVRHGLLPHE
jgi:DNA-binding NarL/FixJ family response regulator